MKKFLLIGFVAITLIGIYTWFFVYNKQHKDIESAKADYTVEIGSLIAEFETQKDSATQKYDEKVVEFDGTVLEILGDDSVSSIVFNGNDKYTLICQVLNAYNKDVQSIQKDDVLHLKGLFVGFNEFDPDFGISGDISFKKCSFSKK